MSDDEAAPQQQPAVQIMQSVTINPMAEFCPDAKVGTSIAIRWKTGNRILTCTSLQAK